MPNKPLRFVLPLCLLCGTILTFPFWLPRVLSALGSNEPDVKPVLSIQEKAHFIDDVTWSHDGKRWSYDAENHIGRWSHGELWRVERAWPSGRQLSNRLLVKGDLYAYKKAMRVTAAKAIGGVDASIRYENVSLAARTGRIVTRSIPRELQVKRGEKVLKSWPVPQLHDAQRVRAFLSPDKRTAAFLVSWPDEVSFIDVTDPKDLRDFLRHDSTKREQWEWQMFRVADGKMLQRRRLKNFALWPESGHLWLGIFEDGLVFDGRGLWAKLTPTRFPLDAPKHLQKVIEFRATRDWTSATPHAEALWRSMNFNRLVFYDALNHRARWFSDSSLQSASAHDVTWHWQLGNSLDSKLMAGIYYTSGSVAAQEKLDSFVLCVWETQSRRLLWRQILADSGYRLDLTKFSPDNRKLAIIQVTVGRTRLTHAIHIFDARTGQQIGPPLTEESPHDRALETSARVQTPFKNGLKRVTDVFATPTPVGALPTPIPSDEFRSFDWAPDSRHIIARHRGGKLKIWRVP